MKFFLHFLVKDTLCFSKCFYLRHFRFGTNNLFCQLEGVFCWTIPNIYMSGISESDGPYLIVFGLFCRAVRLLFFGCLTVVAGPLFDNLWHNKRLLLSRKKRPLEPSR